MRAELRTAASGPAFLALIGGLAIVGCQQDYDIQAEKEGERGTQEEDPLEQEEGEPDEEPDEEEEDDAEDDNTTAPDTDAPVAVCSVTPNPVEPPFETATWIGADSYDPLDHDIVEYIWTLNARPSGSTAIMPTGNTPNRAGFEAQLAGEYVGQLIVVTDDGRRSDPCQVVLESIPAEDLWVEMYWSVANDDMDLHLLAPGGSLTSTSDCYYANKNPNWGSSGSEDDPALDLDDIPGTGPENINIAAPQTGVYEVWVHDFTGSTPDYYGANDVTVNVYINGSLAWTKTKAISGDGDYIPFAAIDWSAGSVSDL
jgi:hypothetical protein